MEIRKDIAGYEGIYQISNFGRVKSLSRFHSMGKHGFTTKDMILKNKLAGQGYHIICMGTPGFRKNKLISRLVALAFIDNPLNKKEVNHIDGNKLNNSVDNLERATHSENQKHRYRMLGHIGAAKGKFGKDNPCSIRVIQKNIDGNIIKIRDSISAITRSLGIYGTQICGCCKKKKTHKTAGGYIREYVK